MWRGLNICHLCILICSIDWMSTLVPAVSCSSSRWSRLFVMSDKNIWVVRYVNRYTAGESRWREMTIVLGNRRGVKCRERRNGRCVVQIVAHWRIGIRARPFPWIRLRSSRFFAGGIFPLCTSFWKRYFGLSFSWCAIFIPCPVRWEWSD